MKQYEIDNIKEQISILELDIKDKSIPDEIKEEMKKELNQLKEQIKGVE